MIKCANCSKEAVYQYNVAEARVLYFCVPHLPGFLKGNTPASTLKSLVKKPTTKKKTATPVVVEETPEGE